VSLFVEKNVISMKKKSAIALLVCVLALPVPTPAAAMEDMFAVMFRMMLVMMNVMSDAMLGNSDNSSFGSNDSFGFGMGGWPAMNGLYGMNPVSGASSFPGMNPWSGMGGYPAMSPWSAMGGFPGYAQGMSPWSTPMMPNALTNPFASGYPPYTNVPYSSSGYGWQPDRRASAPASLLDGRWYGSSGEVFEVSGDRFRLVHGQLAVTGVVKIENNIVNLYSPQTGTVTQYSFVRNQTELMLQDASGMVLNFSKRPANSAVHRF
jgi:hypothetical protein